MNPVLRDRLRGAYLDATLEELHRDLQPPDVAARLFGPPARAPVPRRAPRRAASAAVLAAGLLAVVAIALWSPQGSGAAQDPDRGHPFGGAAFQPLAVGHRWDYRVEDTCSAAPRAVAVEVVGERTTDSGTRYHVRTADADAVEHAFWHADDSGVYRTDPWHLGTHPDLAPRAGVHRVVAGPVGLERTWSWREPLPAHRPDRVVGESTTGRAVQQDATLQGVGVAVEVPAGTFPCAHVQVVCQDEQQRWTEDLYYAAGTGVVQREVRQEGQLLARQQLVRFTPGPPRPDPGAALARFLQDELGADAAAAIRTWVDLGLAGYTVRSHFALVETVDGRRVVRVHDGHAAWFAPDALEAHRALLADEGLDALRGAMWTQSVAEALARTALRLTTAAWGEPRFGDHERKISAAFADGSRGTELFRSGTRADGRTVTLHTSARVHAGVLLELEVTVE